MDLSSTDLILSPKAQTAITALCTLTGGHWHKCTANFVLGNGIPKESAEPLARILRQLLRNLPQVTHRYDEKIA